MVSEKVLSILKNAVNQVNSVKSEVEKEIYNKQYNSTTLPKIQYIEKIKAEKMKALEIQYLEQKEQIVIKAKQEVNDAVEECKDIAKAQVETEVKALMQKSLEEIGGEIINE
jgi:hypothetical protein